MNFAGSHVLSSSQFDRHDVEELFRVADQMLPYAQRRMQTRVLDGAILGNLFFEASTRTRFSFGCAFNLLGGHVRETSDIRTSAISKGESLHDTARIISSYSDVIVMRHPEAGSVAEFSQVSRVPVINAGDGAAEHPSQALLDLYTIKKELNIEIQAMEKLGIAMIGDLKYGRTVHSLAKLLSRYKGLAFTFVSPAELKMPPALVEELRQAGHQVRETDEMEGNLRDSDVVYLTRIQEERFATPQAADLYRGRYRLNQSIFAKHCKPGAVIMHPLPRDSRPEANELDADLNQHPNLAIFRQADNGVLIRMALFALILGVQASVHQSATEVGWFNEKRQPE